MSLDEFEEVLGAVATSVRRAGAELLLLISPCRANLESKRTRTEYQVAQYAFGSRLTLGPGGPPAVVDGAAAITRMARKQPATELFLDDVHTTAAANEGLALAVLQHVQPWLRRRLAN